MNKQLKDLAISSGFKYDETKDILYIDESKSSCNDELKKYTELLIKACEKANKEQSYELRGVIIDTEEGNGFDDVCLNTVKRVHNYLFRKTFTKHFGV